MPYNLYGEDPGGDRKRSKELRAWAVLIFFIGLGAFVIIDMPGVSVPWVSFWSLLFSLPSLWTLWGKGWWAGRYARRLAVIEEQEDAEDR